MILRPPLRMQDAVFHPPFVASRSLSIFLSRPAKGLFLDSRDHDLHKCCPTYLGGGRWRCSVEEVGIISLV